MMSGRAERERGERGAGLQRQTGLGSGRYRVLDGVYGVCYCRCSVANQGVREGGEGKEFATAQTELRLKDGEGGQL